MRQYIKEFDALRAISVLMVLFAHYLGQYSVLSKLASAGVTMFFVLSGFLITGILLYEKEKYGIEGFRLSKKLLSVLRVFYIRRSLRIFPLYYLILFLLILLNVDSARAYWNFHAFYLSNFLYCFYIDMDGLAHFWSLAVEEQFYLVWPVFILFVPKKYISVYFFIIITIASIFFKFLMINTYGLDNRAFSILMPSCIESFSLGAGALLVSKTNVSVNKVGISLAIGFLFFVFLQVISVYDLNYNWKVFTYLFSRTSFSFFAASLLVMVIKGYCGKSAFWVLRNPILLYIGKISYGLYIIHMYVPSMLGYVQKLTGISFSGYGKMFFLSVFCSIGLASLSYFFYERPINRMKKRFAY